MNDRTIDGQQDPRRHEDGRERLLASTGEQTYLRLPVEQVLGMLLQRWVRKGYTPNVDLSAEAIPPGVLSAGEIPVARVCTTDGRELYMTDARVLTRDGTLLEYADLSGYHWITDEVPRCLEEIRRLKAAHFGRLILKLRNGDALALDHLDQAAFPLLRFFDWLLLRAKVERTKGEVPQDQYID